MVATEKRARVLHRLDRGEGTIVCVDDEPVVSRALYRLLSRVPYDVLIAETPSQALRYVRDYDVDLVITDQRMPEMSGVELLEEVRHVSPLTGGLLLTAYPESVMADDPPADPSLPLFAKPWDDDMLRQSVRELIRARGKPSSEGSGPPSGAEGREGASSRPAAPVRGHRSVVVPVDGSIEAEFALGSVLPLLRTDPLRIHLLEVLPHLGHHRDVYARLERTRARLQSEGIDAVADVRFGDPVQETLHHVRQVEADLVLQPHFPTRGWAGLWKRSLAERLLDECPVPVLASGPDLKVRSWARILVPLDGSRRAEAVLPAAVRLAKRSCARILLAGVTPRFVPVGYGFVPQLLQVDDRTPYLKEVAALVESEEVPVEVRFLEGSPAAELLKLAQESDVDLLCMTRRPRSRWARILTGSVSSELLRSARCPVYVRRT